MASPVVYLFVHVVAVALGSVSANGLSQHSLRRSCYLNAIKLVEAEKSFDFFVVNKLKIACWLGSIFPKWLNQTTATTKNEKFNFSPLFSTSLQKNGYTFYFILLKMVRGRKWKNGYDITTKGEAIRWIRRIYLANFEIRHLKFLEKAMEIQIQETKYKRNFFVYFTFE